MMADQKTIALVEQLSNLSTRLSSGNAHAEIAREEALQLSRKLTNSLEKPANVAVDLAFAVSFPNLSSNYTKPNHSTDKPR